jgi:hypothetical protein
MEQKYFTLNKVVNILINSKSILIYGAETFSKKRKHRHKLLVTEMDYLRRSARLSQMDRIRNETITRKMGMKKEEEEQLGWDGHVMRMEDCRIARQVAEWNPQGERMCGRLVSIWKSGIRDKMQRRNLMDEEYFVRGLWGGGGG